MCALLPIALAHKCWVIRGLPNTTILCFYKRSFHFNFFRVINPFDAVVYAFSDIDKLLYLPYPFSAGAKFQLRSFSLLVNVVLSRQNYVHLGLEPYSINYAMSQPAKCSQEVETLLDFFLLEFVCTFHN